MKVAARALKFARFVPYVGAAATAWELYWYFQLLAAGIAAIPAHHGFSNSVTCPGSECSFLNYTGALRGFFHSSHANTAQWDALNECCGEKAFVLDGGTDGQVLPDGATFYTKWQKRNVKDAQDRARFRGKWLRDPGYTGLPYPDGAPATVKVQPNPLPRPSPVPETIPINVPSGRPQPIPYPALPYMPQLPWRQTGPRPQSKPRHGPALRWSTFRRPPGRGTKERKMQDVMGLWRRSGTYRAIGAITEGVDFANALYDALPDHLKLPGKPLFRDKMKQLYRHWDQVDINEAVVNHLTNQANDAAIAGGSQLGAHGSVDAGLFRGVEIGPAL